MRRGPIGLLLNAIYKVRRGLIRARKPLTLGVRCIVARQDGHVLLVRHTYSPGWHLPGGGVKRAEQTEAAVLRELREEAGVTAFDRPKLLGVFSNFALWESDHVVLYVVEEFSFAPRKDWEIAEAGFFDPGALPEDATPATRRRLAEWRAGLPHGPEW